MIHTCKATSFADPRDIEAFRKCKAKGYSDKICFAYGDNGIGYFGDDTSEGSGPSCALTPEDMIEEWGSASAAHNQLVDVTLGGVTVTCVVKDTMPPRAYQQAHNGSGIDLNPDAVRALRREPHNFEDVVTWEPIISDNNQQTTI